MPQVVDDVGCQNVEAGVSKLGEFGFGQVGLGRVDVVVEEVVVVDLEVHGEVRLGWLLMKRDE